MKGKRGLRRTSRHRRNTGAGVEGIVGTLEEVFFGGADGERGAQPQKRKRVYDATSPSGSPNGSTARLENKPRIRFRVLKQEGFLKKRKKKIRRGQLKKGSETGRVFLSGAAHGRGLVGVFGWVGFLWLWVFEVKGGRLNNHPSPNYRAWILKTRTPER